MRLQCPACNQVLDAPSLPQPSVTNLPACSVIIFEHPKPIACMCGALLAPMVTRIRQLDVVAGEVRGPEPPSRIVIPGRSN